jgi:hypothetical protein
MFPLSLPVLEKGPRALSLDKKPCHSSCQEGRVASHTSIQVSTQQAGLHALDFPSMARPETGRGEKGACPAEALAKAW